LLAKLWVKATDLHPVNLGSIPGGTRTSHWLQWEGYPAKIAVVRQ